MTRAYTETEQEYLRSGRQVSGLMLAIMEANTVYTAQVAGTPAGVDGVREIVIDTGSGTLSDVLDGMTVWFGSSAGGYDKGVARVKAIETGLLTIGITSDLPYVAIDDFVTIIDDIGWHPKPVVTDPIDGTLYADDSVAYAGQHDDWKPIVLMGPDVVIELSGASVDVTVFDAGSSWVPDDTVAGYFWSAPGCSAISGDTTATPTITYDTHGTYLVRCQVTATNGEVNSGYRRVNVWNAAHPPVTNFELESFSGSMDSGGWKCKIKAYSGFSFADIYDGAQVILFANERYGDYAGSIGPYSGREHIKMIGWVDGESIDIGYDRSSITFDICGPAEWIKKLNVLGCNLLDGTETPTDWCTIEGMTADKALAELCTWQSTIGAIIDVHPNGDTRRIPSLEVYGSTMWAAFGILGGKIKAAPCCDRYGALYLDVDQQLIEEAVRATLPVVMDISRQDWREEVSFGRKTNPKSSQVDVTGSYWSGGGYTAVRAGSGNFPGRYGQPQSGTMMFEDEDHALLVVGHMRAVENNPYPSVVIKPSANHGMIDICPRQYVTMSLQASDTPRGIVWDTKRLIPRVISIQQGESGKLEHDIECEGETSGPPGVQLAIPSSAPVDAEVDTNYEIAEPDYPMLPTGSIDFPELLSGDDGLAGDGCRDNLNAVSNGPFDLWPDKFFLTTQDSEKLSTLIRYPCMIRSASADNPTYVKIYGVLEYLSGGVWKTSQNPSVWQFEAMDGDQSPVLMAVNEIEPSLNRNRRISRLEPAGQMDVNGFKLSLVEPLAVSGPVDHTFDFVDGPQGWVWNGNGEGRWLDGRIEKSGGDVNWYYYPDELYVASGAYMEASHFNGGPTNSSFASMGIDVVESEDPLVTAYRYVNIRLYPSPIYTAAAGDVGKRVHALHWWTGGSGSRWEWLDDVHIYGFVSNPTGRRLRIDKLEIYNVCGVA